MNENLYASIPIGSLDRPVAYHRIFRDVAGSTVGAIFLSQAFYWTSRLPEERNGWFYKSIEEWEEETGLSRREQTRARSGLKELKILQEERRGIDPTLWFRIDIEMLAVKIRVAFNAKGRASDGEVGVPYAEPRTSPDVQTVHQVMREPHTTRCANRTSPHITESTAETTTEIVLAESENVPQFSGKPKTKKPTTIPDDWWPSNSTLDWYHKNGFPVQQFAWQAEQFKDHNAAKGNTYVDWDRAFMTWIRNAKDWGRLNGKANGNGHSLADPPKPTLYDRQGNYTAWGLAEKAKQMEREERQ